MNVLNMQCLSLNKHWIVCGVRSIKEAVTCLCSESHGDTPAFALDIEMSKTESGEDIMLYANPVDWMTWITLPVRENDLYITTSSRRIRAPTIIICRHYDKVPMTRPRLSSGNIWVRDGGVCQYTGRKLTKSSGNIDHIVPRDRGGRDTWENMALCDKDINSMKGNRLNSEVGLTLIRQPKAPVATPISASITEIRHPEWKPFLLRN